MLISEGVLNKKKKLSATESNAIQVHPHTTVDLLSQIEFSDQVKKAILHHHEHWDGSGYPNGLKGHQIPVLSRILGVLDAYLSMTEDRPYRAALSHEGAIAEIQKDQGIKFDPRVVQALEAAFSG
jgi:HD-GYP domain-containing protein (c-di-GMP phosphodiesterase class II)